MRMQVWTVVVFIFLLISGCGGKEERKETDRVTFPLKGEVVGIEMEKKRLMVAHEEIPNYMMAMTMPFKVKDTTLLMGLEIGDSIHATLVVSRAESWLENIAVIGKDDRRSTLVVGDMPFKKLFKEGEPFPNFTFTNKDGKQIQLSDYRGKVVAFTLIYTRCPLPDFCILMSDNFAKIQRTLAKDRSIKDRWQLLTISFDPTFDRPEVLMRYGKNYGADFSTWEFAVGSESTIRALADGLDLTLADDEGGLIAHNLRTVLMDAQGRLHKIIKGNDWTPDDIVKEVRALIKQSS
jgi:protein SCO1/2